MGKSNLTKVSEYSFFNVIIYFILSDHDEHIITEMIMTMTTIMIIIMTTKMIMTVILHGNAN